MFDNNNLLEHCLGGFEQNSNSVVWALAPKTTSSGKTVLEITADIAVCTFYLRLTSKMEIMKVLEIPKGKNCYNFQAKADVRRVQSAVRSLTDVAKEARTALKLNIKEAEEANVVMEGQLYSTGIANQR